MSSVTSILILAILAAIDFSSMAEDHDRMTGRRPRSDLRYVRHESPTKTISTLIKELSHKDERVRMRAAEELGNRKEKASAVIPALLKALKDKDWDVRHQSTRALEKIGQKAIPALLKAALKDKHYEVRGRAAEVLGKIGLKHSDSVVPTLTKLVEDGDGFVRIRALEALYEFGPKARAAVPTVVGRLNINDSFGVERAAVRALYKIGMQDMYSVAPALVRTYFKSLSKNSIDYTLHKYAWAVLKRLKEKNGASLMKLVRKTIVDNYKPKDAKRKIREITEALNEKDQ